MFIGVHSTLVQHLNSEVKNFKVYHTALSSGQIAAIGVSEGAVAIAEFNTYLVDNLAASNDLYVHLNTVLPSDYGIWETIWA